MRITAELLAVAEQCTNALNERELVLAGLGIPAIENMGVVQDDFDCYNLSNNRLAALTNFAKAPRLTALLAAGNLIASVDVKNLSKNTPNLKYLTLSHNNIASLSQVANIGKACKELEFLDLTGNPVTRRQHYRLYTIYNIPSLKSLDFQKIKTAERETAQRLANSAAGAALEKDLQQEEATTKTFTPGEGPDGTVAVVDFSADEKEQIKMLLTNASSLQEVEDIENSVRKGILPEQLRAAKRQKIA